MTEAKTINLQRPFKHDSGYSWLADIDIEGDSVTVGEYLSDLVLIEDGVPLLSGHASHGDIRTQGVGRFSHWKYSIYFSSSDNTDPNTNGRSYSAKVTARDMAKDSAHYGLKQAWQYAEGLAYALTENPEFVFRDRKVFELGPGPGMASAMAMAAMGACVYVRERESIGWDDGLHGAVAENMLGILEAKGAPFKRAPLEACIKSRAFEAGGIFVSDENRASFAHRLAGTMDYTLSTSVLEHVEDIEDELSCLHEIGTPSSTGFHTIDFRDHHNFEQPLEFLLLDESMFVQSCEYKYSRGNRMRYEQFKAVAETVGFHIERERILQETTPEYAKDFLPRLRGSSSPFQNVPEEWLKKLRMCVCLKKK